MGRKPGYGVWRTVVSFLDTLLRKIAGTPEGESLSPAMAGAATNLLGGLRMSAAVNVAERDAAAAGRPGTLSQAIANSATDLLDALHVGAASGPEQRHRTGVLRLQR